jgi:hypothetical protein
MMNATRIAVVYNVHADQWRSRHAPTFEPEEAYPPDRSAALAGYLALTPPAG